MHPDRRVSEHVYYFWYSKLRCSGVQNKKAASVQDAAEAVSSDPSVVRDVLGFGGGRDHATAAVATHALTFAAAGSLQGHLHRAVEAFIEGQAQVQLVVLLLNSSELLVIGDTTNQFHAGA